MTKKAKKVEDIENLSAPVAPPEPETSVSEESENKALPESSGEKKYARCKGSFHMFRYFPLCLLHSLLLKVKYCVTQGRFNVH